MNFRDFKAAVNAAQLHDLEDTNAEGVELCAHGLLVVIDNSEMESRIEELEEDIERYVKSETDLEAKIEKLEREAEETREVLIAVRHEGEKATLAEYLQRAKDAEERAEKAEESARQASYAREEAQRECVALRRRKGIEAGTVRHARDITALFSRIAYSRIEDLPAYRDACGKLLEKINSA